MTVADMGKDSVYVDSSALACPLGSAGCRDSSFDDAFTRAMARIIDSGVDVKTTSEEYIFKLEWEG